MKNFYVKFLKNPWALLLMAMFFATAANAAIIQVTPAENDSNILKVLLDTANITPGDTIMLDAGTYLEPAALKIFKSVTIMAKPGLSTMPFVHLKASKISLYTERISLIVKGISFSGLKDDGTVTDDFFKVDGPNVGTNVPDTFGIIKFLDCQIREYNRVFHFTGKNTFTCDSLIIDNLTMYNKKGTNFVFSFGDKAYPKVFVVKNSTFYNVEGGIIDNPRNGQSGAPNWTPKMQFIIDHNTFYNVVNQHRSLIQIEKMITKANTTPDSLTIIITNNIIDRLMSFDSTKYGYTTPFRNYQYPPADTICSEANVTFKNNSVSNFDVGVALVEKSNVSAFIAAPNVTASNNLFNYPGFADTSLNDGDGYDLTIPSSSPLLVASNTFGPIGDPEWPPDVQPIIIGEGVHQISNEITNILEIYIEDTSRWDAGDTIMLISPGEYKVVGSTDIFQEVTIIGDPRLDVKPTILFADNGFKLKQDSLSIVLKGFRAVGWEPTDSSSRAGYLLRFDDNNYKNYNNVIIEDIEAWGFTGGIQLYKGKGSLYDSVIVNNVIFHDMVDQLAIDLAQNKVKYVSVTNSTFYNIKKGIMGELWAVKQNDATYLRYEKEVIIEHNTFYNVIDGGTMFSVQNIPDSTVTLTFQNNIASILWSYANARPFRVDTFCGNVAVQNSVLHQFNTNKTGGAFNYDTIAYYPNVTVAAIDTANPYFDDPEGGRFMLSDTSSLLAAGTDGGAIGDPRWVPVAGVTIRELTQKVVEGYDVQMEADVVLGQGADLTVTWSVVNAYDGTAGAATINATTGLLGPTAAGKVQVVATSNHNHSIKGTRVVTIEAKTLVTDITLAAVDFEGNPKTSITNKGGFLTITATITPGGADDKSLTWSVSNTDLASITVKTPATVDITAKLSGEVYVIAAANDGSGVKDSIKITISGQTPVTSITVSATGGVTAITDGQPLQMIATVVPANADNPDVVWTVTNGTGSATISATGLLTPTANGTVTVKATADENQFIFGELEITISGVTAISDASLASISIMPNPASDFIYIKSVVESEITIYNVLGEIELKKLVSPNASVNISDLDAGLYIVNIKVGDDVKSVKLQKK